MIFLLGTLLRKLEGGLRGVSHVFVDEVHERDINVRTLSHSFPHRPFPPANPTHLCVFQTDFLLVMLRDMVNAFPELRVVLMSATVDTSVFAEYFGSTQIVEIHGRVHPVQSACELVRF